MQPFICYHLLVFWQNVLIYMADCNKTITKNVIFRDIILL